MSVYRISISISICISIYPFVDSTMFDIYPLLVDILQFHQSMQPFHCWCDHRRWPGNIHSTTTSVSCGSFVDKPPKTRWGDGVEWCNLRHTVWRFQSHRWTISKFKNCPLWCNDVLILNILILFFQLSCGFILWISVRWIKQILLKERSMGVSKNRGTLKWMI